MLEHYSGYSPSELERLSDQEVAEIRAELVEHGREIVLAAPDLFIDVDVEADGKAGFGSMRSVGAVSPTGETFYSEVRPYTGMWNQANFDFCEKHGLEYKRMLEDSPELNPVMQAFEQWLSELQDIYDRRVRFVAFNAGFDWAHIDLNFTIAGTEPNPFGTSPVDIKSLALPFTSEWSWSETQKTELPKIVVPEREFTHHALEDAQWQQELHFAIAGLYDRVRGL